MAAPLLTPERRALQDTARAFAMEEVLPVADELDPRREDIPRSLLDRMGELGFFGILVDAEHGGLGLGVVEYCLVSEELARAWMSVGSIIARGNGTGLRLARSRAARRAAARQRRGPLHRGDRLLRAPRGVGPRGRRVHRAA